MARPAGITVIGDKKLIKKLKRLGPRIFKKSIKKPLRRGAKPFVKSARGAAQRETNTLRKSLGVRIRTYGRSGVIMALIGPRSSITGVGPDGRVRKPVKYAHLVEFGTDETPARPFMRPAWEQNKQAAAKRIPIEIRAEVEKLAMKR